jgi:hypothetical protein
MNICHIIVAVSSRIWKNFQKNLGAVTWVLVGCPTAGGGVWACVGEPQGSGAEWREAILGSGDITQMRGVGEGRRVQGDGHASPAVV